MEDDPERSFFSLLKSLFKRKSHIDDSNDLNVEIHDLMDEGQAKGLISDDESHMVYGVLDLKEMKAHSIMVPRMEISSASLDSTLRQVIDLVTECGHTRIPIHKDNIDQIVGILHSKDLLRFLGENGESNLPQEVLRAPFFVPETRRVSDLLKDLQEKRHHLAVVTDEYGGTAGIITIEDILEEIVGEIMDEHDNETDRLIPLDDGGFLVAAPLEVEKLEEAMQIELPEETLSPWAVLSSICLAESPKWAKKFHFKGWKLLSRRAINEKLTRSFSLHTPTQCLRSRKILNPLLQTTHDRTQ